jgi:hypothetical protein
MTNKNKLLKTLSNDEIRDLLRSTYEAALNGDNQARKMILELYFEKPGSQSRMEVNNNFAETKLTELETNFKHKVI